LKTDVYFSYILDQGGTNIIPDFDLYRLMAITLMRKSAISGPINEINNHGAVNNKLEGLTYEIQETDL